MCEQPVSVIMTNHNTSEEYLRCAIESILNQTYQNFEFIIIDDGSDDGSPDIIREYQAGDNRIKLFFNGENKGITKSLNTALGKASGEFIARMDADDESFPQRIEKQILFMNENPDVIVCGTYIHFIGEGANEKKDRKIDIADREEFRIRQLFGNHMNICHPSAMFRKSLLDKFSIRYFEQYPVAQDYRMWIECGRYARCANVPEVLFNYRINSGAVSVTKAQLQRQCTQNIVKEQLEAMGVEMSDEMFSMHFGYLTDRKFYSQELYDWLCTLIEANKRTDCYDNDVFERLIWTKWADIVYHTWRSPKEKYSLSAMLKTLPADYKSEFLKLTAKRFIGKKRG